MEIILLYKICCFQWFKDTNLKANHNPWFSLYYIYNVVSNGSKILIWKQITTQSVTRRRAICCFQWFKDTNLKANHNLVSTILTDHLVVSNGSKILIWKQITTFLPRVLFVLSCFQWFKDTNLKANHNSYTDEVRKKSVVSNGSKILIWKQITTKSYVRLSTSSCFQWFKDTNLKANHNILSLLLLYYQLFPMVQRY